MADRIVIDFGANTSEVERAGRKIDDTLDDTKKSLEDVGDTGEKSLDKITKAQDDTAKSAGDLAKGVGGELSQSFESFDGTATGALEGVAQGVSGLAALVPGVGGLIGAGLGTALTEGVKLFTSGVDAEAKVNEERIKTMYDNFIESGLTYYTVAQTLSATSAIQNDVEKYNKLLEQAKVLGLDIETVVLAQVQAGDARNQVMSRGAELLAADNKALEDGTYTLGTHLTTVEAIVGEYGALNGQQSEATQKAAVYASIAEQVTGEQKLTNEQIQIQNRLLAETPKTLPVTLEVDRSAIDQALQRRTLRIDIEGYTRYGQRVV